MKVAMLGVIFAAILVAAVFLLREANDVPRGSAAASVKQPEVLVKRRQSPELVLDIKPGTSARPRAPASASKVSPLMQELATGPRKPLYDRLSQATSRTPEESYVLARILQNCAQVEGKPPQRSRKTAEDFAKTVSDKDPNRTRRLAAHQKMSEPRCEGLGDVRATPAEIRDLLEQAAAGGDPKARVRLVEREMFQPLESDRTRPPDSLPRISDQQLATLREAAASGDPYALLVTGSILASTLGDLVIRVGPDERPIDPRAFHDAWTLTACDAGYDCGTSNPIMLSSCAGQGNCDARDLREHLFFYGHSPQQSQLISEYQAQIGRAIRSGDWSYFSFFRATPPPGSVFRFGSYGP